MVVLGSACALDPDPRLGPVAPGHPLAYVSQGLAGSSDIFLLSADASTDQNLTQFTAYDGWPSWSPNGQLLAFETDRNAASSALDVYTLSLSTGFALRLTADTFHYDDAEPAWSPLGNRIAFVSNRDSAGFDIYLMNTDGSNVKRLTTDASNETQPAWSPDGTKIAFATDRDGPTGEIYVMDTTGGNVVNLTNSTSVDLTPAWSPDGTKIAFASVRDTVGFAIWVMNADGSSPVQLSPNDPPCELPSWTPDGLRLAFDCDADIWVVNANGSGLTRITRTTNQQRGEAMPRWKPVP